MHDLRLKMATAGLPKGAVSGFELMDSARFGQTQFQERLTFQRGLEGELTRSIGSLAAVQAARVHLALPNQNGFFREQQKPSASVLLTLHPGRALDRAQIAGIVHLVSSSVPEMSPKAVSMLDQSGALLTGGGDAARRRPRRAAAAVRQPDRGRLHQAHHRAGRADRRPRQPARQRHRRRRLLADRGDLGRVQAEPGRRREHLDPQPADDRARRRRRRARSPAAFPGAASNQPPIAATAPLTGASQPLQGAPSGDAAGSGGRREAVTNYEVDKTVRVTKSATGNVKRLNAAVVVNNRSVTDAKGKTTQVPLTTDEIEKLTALVREIDRLQQGARRFGQGDQRAVQGRPGRRPRETPFWKSPELIDLIRAAALPAGLDAGRDAGLLRPGATGDEERVRGAAGAAGAAGSADRRRRRRRARLSAARSPRPRTCARSKARKALAKDNPAAVAGIVRGWVGGESTPR